MRRRRTRSRQRSRRQRKNPPRRSRQHREPPSERAERQSGRTARDGAEVLLHSPAGTGGGDLDRHRAPRSVRDPPASDRALSADHTARGPHHGELSGRIVRRRGAGGGRADRGTARWIAGDALLLLGERERRQHEHHRHLRRLAQSGSRGRRRAERGEARGAAVAAGRAHQRDHDSQGEHRHSRGGRRALRRPAVRRDIPREFHEVERRGRTEARARRGRCNALPRPRLLDAPAARSRQDGAAAHHGERCGRRRARTEYDEPRGAHRS